MFERPPLSLFKNQQDLSTALWSLLNILVSNTQSNQQQPELQENYYEIVDCLEKIKKEKPELSYMNVFHIVELFLKDPKRRIILKDTLYIKIKKIKYVAPPQILYFGTLEHLAGKMKSRGISSTTKGYIKLYDGENRAIDFARKFVKKDTDKICTLKIDSLKAFEDGLSFSTHIDHEFIIREVPTKYILVS